MKGLIDTKSMKHIWNEFVHDATHVGSLVFQLFALLFLLFIDTTLFWKLFTAMILTFITIMTVRLIWVFKKRPAGIVIPRNVVEKFQHSSLVSSHAASAFAFALVIGLHTSLGILIFLICIALLVCYSRLKLKKHFPVDVFTGSVLGIVTGLLATGFVQLFV